PTNHFTPVWTGNGYLQMNIEISGVDLIGGGSLIAGDEIGVFDGMYCVGTVKLTESLAGSIQIITSTDDPNTTELDGFINGHTISYKFWLSALAEEISDYTANYASGNGSFESEGTAIVEFTSVLPVELVSFTADFLDNKVRLRWQTATEINNYGFEVERKLNENDWNSLGFVEGYGNSSSPKAYLFTDNTLVGGSKFQYRLKQIDTDGQFKYSDIVEVEILPDRFDLFQNYPNPFNPTTKIRYQLPVESKVVIKIYDILGSEVVTLLNEEKEPGSYEVEFNATSLSSGTYIYRIVAGDFVEMKKMVLMK
ncbi:MAG TPA: T9SS type A sorting domain-containing protein, partial [Ignavibacteriaceae bacterium]